MFKKQDPNSFTRYFQLFLGTNQIGYLSADYQVVNYENVQVKDVQLDIEMPIMDGKETLEHLRKHFPEIKVLVLTMHQHDSFIVHMMEIGANGYLLKESPPDEVIDAIRTVKKEGMFFNPRTSKALLGKITSSQSSKPGWNPDSRDSLNQREIDVLRLICDEKTTLQIAEELFLSPKTVEGYRKNLLEKTGSKNVAGLVK
ncbi:response regulator transcription factor [Fluviicola taffensis]|uniref:response regulator transcription factor n=1 Tax=Fluviicola taffensis TaxID=191579 RepID=UPI003137A209